MAYWDYWHLLNNQYSNLPCSMLVSLVQNCGSRHTVHLHRIKPLFVVVQALVRSRVEPKVFFANERTFLSW